MFAETRMRILGVKRIDEQRSSAAAPGRSCGADQVGVRSASLVASTCVASDIPLMLSIASDLLQGLLHRHRSSRRASRCRRSVRRFQRQQTIPAPIPRHIRHARRSQMLVAQAEPSRRVLFELRSAHDNDCVDSAEQVRASHAAAAWLDRHTVSISGCWPADFEVGYVSKSR